MKRLALLLLLSCLLGSCDKARKLADKAQAAAKGQMSRSLTESSESVADPKLLELADVNEEGVIFRKDLPFPESLEVRVAEVIEFQKVRVFLRSELGSQSAVLQNTLLRTTLYKLSGDAVRITLETLQTSEPPASDSQDEKPVVTVDLLQGGTLDFELVGGKWSASGTTDFRKAVWKSDLLPHLPVLLANAGARPRPLWFAKKRIKVGEVISIGEKFMPMFFDENTSGNLELTFEGQESVHGHPCGVFAVKGDYSRKNAPGAEGTLTDQEVTIESGKLWLSLLHPVVMRSDLQTIQSCSTGKGTGPAQRMSGSIRVTSTSEWMPKEKNSG